MRHRILVSAAVLLMAGSVAACGGGGGGGGPSTSVTTPAPAPTAPTPPPLPTPAPPPAGSSASAVVWIGPSMSVKAGTAGFVRQLDNAASGISVVYDSQGTASTADDRYTVRYGPDGYERSFTNLTPASDKFGTYRRSVQTVGGLGEAFYVMDISNVFASSLNHVQMVSFERDVSATQAQLAFLTVGVQTPRESMPTTGTARFEGQTRGLISTFSDNLWGTTSDIEMTANFASGALTGSTSNFKTTSLTGTNSTLANDMNFTFSGSITAGTANFTGAATAAAFGGPGLTGTVQGAFFGPAANEVGLTYGLSMSTSQAWMQGAAVLGRKP